MLVKSYKIKWIIYFSLLPSLDFPFEDRKIKLGDFPSSPDRKEPGQEGKDLRSQNTSCPRGLPPSPQALREGQPIHQPSLLSAYL
jgi:hypothetical protein